MFKKLTATLLLVSASALAGLPPTTIKSQNGTKSGFFNLQTPSKQVTKVDGTTALIETGSQNLVENPGFEALSISTGWTASGGTLAKTTTSGQFRQESGKAAASWDSSAASQTMSGTAFTVSSGMNAEVSVWVKISSGSATHKLQVTDGTNVVAEVSINQDTSGFVKTSLNFATVAGTSYTPRLISVASNEPTIYVDDFYGGAATNVGSVAQAQFMGSIGWVATTGCTWSRTSSTLANYSADVDCDDNARTVTGSVVDNAFSTPGQYPAFVLKNVQPGKYLIIGRGRFAKQNTSNDGCYFAFSDQTNTSAVSSVANNGQEDGLPTINGEFNYTTGQGDVTFSVVARNQSAGACAIVVDESTTGKTNLEFSVYRFPTSSEIAYRPELQALSWSGYHGSISGGCASTSATFADPTACTGITLNQLTNRNFGTVTTASGSLPGITFTPVKTGMVYVCATPYQSGSGAAQNWASRLVDGSGTIINPGVGGSINLAAGKNISLPICGIYNVTDLTSKTIKLQMAISGGSSTNYSASPQDGGANITWSIFALDQNIPAPVLVPKTGLVASFVLPGTSSCILDSATSSTLAAFAAVSACPGPTVEFNDTTLGTAQTTDTNGPDFTINNLQDGTYEVEAVFPGGAAVANSDIHFAINDGTTTSGTEYLSVTAGFFYNVKLLGTFTYSTTGNRTFSIWGAGGGGTGKAEIINNDSGKRQTIVHVRKVK